MKRIILLILIIPLLAIGQTNTYNILDHTAGSITSTTWTARTSAVTAGAGAVIRVSDIGGATGSQFVSDGTNWRPLNGTANLYVLPSRVTMTGTTETAVASYPIPIGLLQNGDRIQIRNTFSKTGTSETLTHRYRIGTNCTKADTGAFTSTAMTTVQVSNGFMIDFERASSTTIQRVGNAGTNPYSGISSLAFPSAITVSSLDSNTVCITTTLMSSSTVETMAMEDMTIQLFASP